jgi:hypothetical protein
MKPGLVPDHRIEEDRIFSRIGALGGHGRPLSRQGFDDVARIACLDQAGHLLLIAQNAGEPSQHLNVFVGFSSDAYN